MREIFKISALVAAFFAMLALVSCSKTGPAAEEYAEDEKIAIEVRVNAGAEVTVKSGDNQGSTIESLKVWGYEITGENKAPAQDSLPVVFGEFNDDEGIIHMLASCVGKTYRFMAVANDALFGKMYKAREHYGAEEPLTLNSHLTYKELSTAVFDASAGNDGIFKFFPNPDNDTPVSMPFSHWTDVTIEQGTTTLEIQVFRPIAKTQLFAKITNANDGILLIKSASIKSAHNFAVPNEGFLFSSANATDLPDTQITKIPAYWGEYNDLTVLVPDIWLKNNTDGNSIDFVEKEVTDTDDTFIGSTFLYENNNGEDLSTASHTSTDAYDYGAYYMEINYSYGPDSNGDGTIDNETEKTGKNYIPLPATIRNRDYKINATFDISRGLINVAFTVSDWEQTDIESGQSGANGSGDDVQDVEFAYPTFEIWPVKTIPDTNPAEYDYSQPVARYHATNPEPFQFYFRMQEYNNRRWTISLADGNDSDKTIENENNAFSIKLHKSLDNTVNGIWDPVEFNEISAAGELYKVSITPKGTLASAATTTANVIITYYASWLGGNDHLLINSGGGGTLWSHSGHERHQILVTQGADITN